MASMITSMITSTVVVSAITSAAVSIVTFVIGVRVSKDQGDRSVLRDIYERLFQHFRTLREALRERRPKLWRDFPLEGDHYTPPFAKMSSTGEATLIPDALARRCEETERRTLVAGGTYVRWVSETVIPLVRRRIGEIASNPDKSISGRSYRRIHVSALGLINEEELREMLSGVSDHGLGVGLELALDRGRTDVLYLYPERMMNLTVAEGVSEIWRSVRYDKDADALRVEIQHSAVALDALLLQLSDRIRDPHPLMESIKRSLKDVLRGR